MLRSMIVVSTLMLANASAAMILGFGAEVDHYLPEITGDFKYNDDGFVTATHFDQDRVDTFQLGAFFEHPVPLIPNVRLDYTSGTTFSGDNTIGPGDNNIEFTQLDATLYYEILDNIVDVDVGITGKLLEGDITGVINQNFDVFIPMAYVAAAIKIPQTPIRIDANVKYVTYDGSSLSDIKIKGMWEVFSGLEAVAGYRYESLDLERDGVDSNVEIQGPFVGIGYRF